MSEAVNLWMLFWDLECGNYFIALTIYMLLRLFVVYSKSMANYVPLYPIPRARTPGLV